MTSRFIEIAAKKTTETENFTSRPSIKQLKQHYDDAYPYSCGLARVRKETTWGYVDESMREVIPLIFNDARDFQNNFAFVNEISPNAIFGIAS